MNPLSTEEKQTYHNLLYSKTDNPKENQYYESEYMEHYNANRLYQAESTQQYVSKKIHDESEFWKGGKYAYDNKELKDNVIYKTTNRNDHSDNKIPEEFQNKDNNMRKTRISEYSNALYNNTVS